MSDLCRSTALWQCAKQLEEPDRHRATEAVVGDAVVGVELQHTLGIEGVGRRDAIPAEEIDVAISLGRELPQPVECGLLARV